MRCKEGEEINTANFQAVYLWRPLERAVTEMWGESCLLIFKVDITSSDFKANCIIINNYSIPNPSKISRKLKTYWVSLYLHPKSSENTGTANMGSLKFRKAPPYAAVSPTRILNNHVQGREKSTNTYSNRSSFQLPSLSLGYCPLSTTVKPTTHVNSLGIYLYFSKSLYSFHNFTPIHIWGYENISSNVQFLHFWRRN